MYNEAKAHITRVLNDYQIEYTFIVAQDQCRFTDAEIRSTLLIGVDETTANPKSWKAAAQKIHDHFRQQGYSDLHYELRVPSKCPGRSIKLDPPPSEAVASFASVKDQIASLAFDPASPCFGFGLYMVEQSPAPTVMILVDDGSSYDWVQFSTACHLIAAPCLSLSRCNRPDFATRCLLRKLFLVPIPIGAVVGHARLAGNGASIGTQENLYSSGTLGPYVVLQHLDPSIDQMLCCLMNQHVVQLTDPSVAEESCIKGVDPEFLSRRQIKLSVQSPSVLDSKSLDIAKRDLGDVIYTSGVRRDGIMPDLIHCPSQSCLKTNCYLDWGIIRVFASVFSTNKAPPKSMFLPAETDNYHCGDNTVIKELAAPKANLEVYKIGRTTGPTKGVIM